MIRRLQCAALCLLVCTASAQTSRRTAVIWEPPLLTKSTDEIPKGSVPKDIVAKLRVSGVDITLEQTKLSDVQSQLGGTIGHRGDAGEYLEWLCLDGTANKNGWVLWLMGGEIDGGSIGGFHWQRIPPGAQLDSRCRKLSDTEVELPIAVRLGMTQSALLHTLGQPTRRQGKHGNSLLYVHEQEQSIGGEAYTETNTLAALIRRGVVWGIEVWKSTVS